MLYNPLFGKITNGTFEYAPRDLAFGGRTYVCCDNPELYYAAEFRDVVEDKEDRVGVVAVFDHAEQEEDRYEHHTETDPETGETFEWDELVYRGKVIRRYRYEPIPEPVPVPNVYDVPDLFWWVKQNDMETLENGGEPRLPKIEAMLDEAGMYTIAVTTKTVDDANEVFEMILGMMKTLFSEDEIAEALTYAKVEV